MVQTKKLIYLASVIKDRHSGAQVLKRCLREHVSLPLPLVLLYFLGKLFLFIHVNNLPAAPTLYATKLAAPEESKNLSVNSYIKNPRANTHRSSLTSMFHL